jgi:hypothetical protein
VFLVKWNSLPKQAATHAAPGTSTSCHARFEREEVAVPGLVYVAVYLGELIKKMVWVLCTEARSTDFSFIT